MLQKEKRFFVYVSNGGRSAAITRVFVWLNLWQRRVKLVFEVLDHCLMENSYIEKFLMLTSLIRGVGVSLSHINFICKIHLICEYCELCPLTTQEVYLDDCSNIRGDGVRRWLHTPSLTKPLFPKILIMNILLTLVTIISKESERRRSWFFLQNQLGRTEW